MPFRFVLANYNLTDVDIIEDYEVNNEINEHWTHEEVQIVVLAVFLLVVIFAFIAVTGMDCFARRCNTCLGPLIVVENKEDHHTRSTAPPPYSPPLAYTKTITHVDYDPPQYSTSHITHLTIS
ncbi:hypothetical protein COOONC_08435 [Cooperia oncophora]